MLWPFNHFRKPRIAPRGTIEAIYGMIVTQAREPLFYRDLGVPDTVNGRFDLLLLHLWLLLRRLKRSRAGTALSQALFDHFCERYGRQSARNGGRRPDRPEADAGLRRGLLRPRSAYDLALTERARGAGAGDLQEYPEWRRRWTTRGGLPPMPRPRWPLSPARRGDAACAVPWRFPLPQRMSARHERTGSDHDQPIPGASPVVVAQIPDTGLHRELEADRGAAQAMAELAGLREVLSAQARST